MAVRESVADHSGLPPRPLLIRFGRLGDTLLLQPMLHHLQQRYGQACDLLAVGAWPLPLYQGQPDVATVYALQAVHRPLLYSPERWRLLWQLRRMRDRPVYIAEPQPNSLRKIRRLLKLAGIADEHCCYIRQGPDSPLHEADKLLAFAEMTPPAFAGRVPPARATQNAPHLQVSSEAREAARQWLQGQGLTPEKVVLLQPSNKRTMRWNGVRATDDDDKSWPIARWAELAQGLVASRPDLQVLICGSAAEADYVQAIASAGRHPSIRSAAGQLPLPRLLALQAMAHSMISVDTGPAHLAAAVGCPLVVLFGGLPIAQWCPRSATGSPVLALGGAGVVRRVDQISVDQVLAAWRSMLVPVGGSGALP